MSKEKLKRVRSPGYMERLARRLVDKQKTLRRKGEKAKKQNKLNGFPTPD